MRRVLWCLRWGIGDVVTSEPVWRALRRAERGSGLTVLGAFPAAELFAGQGVEVKDVADLGVRGAGEEGDRSMAAAWLAEGGGFDLALDVVQSPKAVAEALWAGGVETKETDGAAVRRAAASGAGVSAALAAGVEAGWGLKVDDVRPRVEARDCDAAWASAWLAGAGLGAGEAVALCPGASHPLKRWPAAKFAAVAVKLRARRVVVVEGGQPDSADGVEQAVESMRPGTRVVRLRAEHLLRVSAVLARCRLVVTNDTGVMHLSAAVGTPTAGVFGPTSVGLMLPRGVQVKGVGVREACEWRQGPEPSPPACWARGRCLREGRTGCVSTVSASRVTRAAREAMSGGRR